MEWKLAKALIVRNSRVQIVFESTSTEFAAEAFRHRSAPLPCEACEKEKLFGILDRFFVQRLLPEDCERESRTAGREHLSFRHPLCGGRWKTGKVRHQKRRDGGSPCLLQSLRGFCRKKSSAALSVGRWFPCGENCGNAYRCAEIIGSDRNSHQPFKAQGNTGNLCGLQLAKHQTPHAGKNRIIL